MIHAFFVALGVLAAIAFFPYIAIVALAIFASRIFWLSLLALVAFWALSCFVGIVALPIIGFPFFLWYVIAWHRERVNMIQVRRSQIRLGKDWDRTAIYFLPKSEISLADRLGDLNFKD
jgi:hypothetical protein